MRIDEYTDITVHRCNTGVHSFDASMQRIHRCNVINAVSDLFSLFFFSLVIIWKKKLMARFRLTS